MLGVAQNQICVRRADDVLIPKTLLTVQQVNVSTVLTMVFSDGSVESRDRMTLQVLAPDENDDQISSLYQIGFNFLGARPCKWASSMEHTKTKTRSDSLQVCMRLYRQTLRLCSSLMTSTRQRSMSCNI